MVLQLNPLSDGFIFFRAQGCLNSGCPTRIRGNKENFQYQIAKEGLLKGWEGE
ncbi:hypothetical protein KKC1_16180 [Calderihabitans maritimus]|uniref:Uncharacterized protein n=1 Tax=Calderihabitans maritimus TaxID=1246530 RepID=A0A1Z5HSG8_9FIRM|nr:hypothetical protein KKC1_16180 [Calderihabitans maritimus]